MAPSTRASRYSTYSTMAPSLAPTEGTTDSTTAEINEISNGLQRMENRALSRQRVTLSEAKVERMGKLALGAKLERALERRMSGQDAVMRPRRKTASEVPSAATTLAIPDENDEKSSMNRGGPDSLAEEHQSSLVATHA